MNILERYITYRIIQEDAETIFSILKSERNPIFNMEIIPYYALFIQSCRELNGILDEKDFGKRIKDIRNFIKIYSEGYGKTQKRILAVNEKQDVQYKSQLRCKFVKKVDSYYNMGTYWTDDRHVIGNTQMLADFLEIDNIFDENQNKMQYELAKQIASFISSLRNSLSDNMQIPIISRPSQNIDIRYYYDLNINKGDLLFKTGSSTTLNIFLLNLLCNMNFVRCVLRPLVDKYNLWVLRIEYNVTYYTYKSLVRLKNYDESNNNDFFLENIADLDINTEKIFSTKFRNCMMHYGLENEKIIVPDNIKKPFYGIVESCYEGKDFYDFVEELRKVSNKVIKILELNINSDEVILERL